MPENNNKIAPGFLGWVSYLVLTHRHRLTSIAKSEGLNEQDGAPNLRRARNVRSKTKLLERYD